MDVIKKSEDPGGISHRSLGWLALISAPECCDMMRCSFAGQGVQVLGIISTRAIKSGICVETDSVTTGSSSLELRC